jgi:plastocyanin
MNWHSLTAPFVVAGVLLSAVPATAASYSAIAAHPGVVWVTQTGGETPPPMAGAEIRQTGKTFVPDLLVVPVGTSVRFPNDDGFYHSVYSESPSNPFDIGLYDTGPGKSVVFDQPGVVTIRCHVHGSMHATLIVVDGPFATTTTPNQRYTIAGLVSGVHELHSWSGGDAVETTTIRIK